MTQNSMKITIHHMCLEVFGYKMKEAVYSLIQTFLAHPKRLHQAPSDSIRLHQTQSEPNRLHQIP